jgi:hypothetical protein
MIIRRLAPQLIQSTEVCIVSSATKNAPQLHLSHQPAGLGGPQRASSPCPRSSAEPSLYNPSAPQGITRAKASRVPPVIYPAVRLTCSCPSKASWHAPNVHSNAYRSSQICVMQRTTAARPHPTTSVLPLLAHLKQLPSYNLSDPSTSSCYQDSAPRFLVGWR